MIQRPRGPLRPVQASAGRSGRRPGTAATSTARPGARSGPQQVDTARGGAIAVEPHPIEDCPRVTINASFPAGLADLDPNRDHLRKDARRRWPAGQRTGREARRGALSVDAAEPTVEIAVGSSASYWSVSHALPGLILEGHEVVGCTELAAINSNLLDLIERGGVLPDSRGYPPKIAPAGRRGAVTVD